MRGQRGYKLPSTVTFSNAPTIRLSNAEFTYPSVLSKIEQRAKELLNAGQISQNQYTNYMTRQEKIMKNKIARQTQKQEGLLLEMNHLYIRIYLNYMRSKRKIDHKDRILV